MKTLAIIFKTSVFLIIMILGSACNNEKDRNLKEVFSTENMDLSIKPGNDFFNYVNGNWIKNHPIPPDKSKYDNFIELDEKNRNEILKLISKASDKRTGSSDYISQIVGDFYSSGMDSLLIEELELKPIQDFFTRIETINDIRGLQEALSYLQPYGVNPFFEFFAYPDFDDSKMMIANIYQAGLGLPDRDYYFRTDKRSVEIRKAYLDHLTKTFELLNYQPDIAYLNARKVIEIETNLAQASFTIEENQNPQKINNKYTISELDNLTRNFNWKFFVSNLGYPGISKINIFQPTFITKIDTLLNSVQPNDWKIFLKWKVINTYSPFLGEKFACLKFDFYSKTLGGLEIMPPRWKRVFDVTSRILGEPVGQLYVKKFFPPEAKEKMIGLINNLKVSLAERIQNLNWMGPETKIEALAKLDNMYVKVGYPDKWRDYAGLEIKSNEYARNIMRASKFDFIYSMGKIGKQVDRSDWNTTPQTINAWYDASLNDLTFPAGILQPPVFNLKADDAINYGAIGFVIGHEITHGFDNGGRQFDKNGNLKDWWSENDAKEFESRTKILVDQFNKYEVLDSLFINGINTLGENISDFGGATIAYYAYQKTLSNANKNEEIDGFSGNQRFFLSIAQFFRGSRREESMRIFVNTNPHSPEKFRVIGTLFNMPEFYEAFPDIDKDDLFYIPPEQRPIIW